MARFNSEAYDKLFPRSTEVEHVETAVSTFRPTEQKLEEDSVDDSSVESAVEVEEVEDNGHDTDS